MSTVTHADHETGAADPIAELMRVSEQNIWACYQCGTCTSDCPFSLTPSLVVRMLQMGHLEGARRLATTWECATCYTCQTRCPKGVSPARLIKALRNVNPHGVIPKNGNGSPQHGTAGEHETTLRTRLLDRRNRLRARVLATMPLMFQKGSRFAPLSNLAMRVPGARLVAHVGLGLHKARPVPALASETFPKWFATHTPVGDGHRGRVMLFHDTSMDYNYPGVGKAMTELLEKAGYSVELTATGCCGRPAISKGVHDVAEKCARGNIPNLFDQVKTDGAYIVGAEPSCLLTLRDEYLHLAPELHDPAAVVAKRAMLIDEFLVMLHEKGELELTFKPMEGRRVLYHGHCHQKAFADPAKGLALLRAAGYDAELINAACCGMAGAYGYEKEHYEPSRRAGERALFPALRDEPDADVVIMGVSCRQQIEHFMKRPVKHFVEALRDAVV